MKRLTAEEVAEQFEAMGASAGGAWNHAAQIVRENLIPQWHDEPDGDGGLVWVKFSEEEKNSYRWGLPFSAWKENGEWWIEDQEGFTMRLDGRQVCPIGARPQ